MYFLVSLYFVCLYMLLCRCTFHVNRLDLCIFTGCFTYLPKIHIYRNIYNMYTYVYNQAVKLNVNFGRMIIGIGLSLKYI